MKQVPTAIRFVNSMNKMEVDGNFVYEVVTSIVKDKTNQPNLLFTKAEAEGSRKDHYWIVFVDGSCLKFTVLQDEKGIISSANLCGYAGDYIAKYPEDSKVEKNLKPDLAELGAKLG